jgi:hypothetical protein
MTNRNLFGLGILQSIATVFGFRAGRMTTSVHRRRGVATQGQVDLCGMFESCWSGRDGYGNVTGSGAVQ